MRVLVYGGPSSGKSALAETAALALPGPHVYLATMEAADEAALERIARHRAQREGKGFVTVECPLLGDARAAEEAAGIAPGSGTLLVEDIGNAVGNFMFASHGGEEGAQPSVFEAVIAVAADAMRLADAHDDIVFVGNVFDDDPLYDAATCDYVEASRLVTELLAEKCDAVAFCDEGAVSVEKGALP